MRTDILQHPSVNVSAISTAVLTFIWALGVLCGCHLSPVKGEIERQKEVLQQANKLYGDYLAGDVDHARRSLQEEIQLFEECKGVSPYFRAAFLFLEWS